MSRRVVVTGMGIVAPNGANIEQFDASLRSATSGIRFSEDMKNHGLDCHVSGASEVPQQLPDFFSDYGINKASDFCKMACVAAVEAWKNAGLEIPAFDSTEVDWDTGILIGTTIAGIDTVTDRLVPLTDEGKIRRIGSFGTVNAIASGPSAFLSAVFAAGNLTIGNSAACSTSLTAIESAYHRIKSGRAKRMVCGGADPYSPYYWASLDALRVFTRMGNENPAGASRPMSASANGFVPASGAGILVLEDLDSALARGANILAEVLSGESNCGGQRNGGSLTFPNSEGVKRCIESAINNANIQSSEIDLISGHLTATKADPLEIDNWKKALGGVKFPLINSTKSLTGHGIAAAGAWESIASILQMKGRYVHASVNCEDLHPEIASNIPPECIARETIENIDIKTIIKASFGFGDVNSAVVYRLWEES